MKKKKYCENCGSRENLVIGHRDGNESNGAPYNLGTFCKSCNGKQAIEDKRRGRGVRTRQYNPQRVIAPAGRGEEWEEAEPNLEDAKYDDLLEKYLEKIDRKVGARNLTLLPPFNNKDGHLAQVELHGNHVIMRLVSPEDEGKLLTDLHECAHVLLGHLWQDSKPDRTQEHEATEWAIETARKEGVKIPQSEIDDMRKYARSFKNPCTKKNPGATNLAQYVQAAIEHSRGSHDEGGRIIHETPKSKRREFAREIWFRRGYRNPAEDIMTEWRAGKLRTSAGDLVPRGKAGERQARAILLSELRREGKIGPRENPDGSADQLYRKFHGVKPDSHLVFDVSLIDPYGSHPEIAQFGLLVRMIVGEGIEVKASANTEDVDVTALEDYAWNAEIAFVPSIREYKKDARTLRTQQDIDQFKSWLRKNGTPDVAGSPDAKQIYIIGGNLDVVEDRLAYMGADTSKEVVDLGFLYLIEYFTQKNFDGMDPVDYFHHMGEKTKVRPRVIFWRKPQVLQIVGGEYRITARGIEN